MTNVTNEARECGDSERAGVVGEAPARGALGVQSRTFSGVRPRLVPSLADRRNVRPDTAPFPVSEPPTLPSGEVLDHRLLDALGQIRARDRQIRDLEARLEVLTMPREPTHLAHGLGAGAAEPSSERLALSQNTSTASDACATSSTEPEIVRWGTLSFDTCEAPSRPAFHRTREASARAPDEFEWQPEFYAGLDQDIARGGIFVPTYRRVPIGTKVQVSFELPHGTTRLVRGTVQWVRDLVTSGHPGVGIAFDDLAPEVISSLVPYCKRIPPLYVDG